MFCFRSHYPHPTPAINLPLHFHSAIFLHFEKGTKVQNRWKQSSDTVQSQGGARVEIWFQLSGTNSLLCGGCGEVNTTLLISRVHGLQNISIYVQMIQGFPLLDRGLCIICGGSMYSVKLLGICSNVIC